MRETKIYSVTWQMPVMAGAAWNAFFNIPNPGRQMDIKGIYFNIIYRDFPSELNMTEEQCPTQRIQLACVPALASANYMDNTGGAAFFDNGNLYFFRSCNIKFNGFLFSNLIPFTINGWNNHVANMFYHNVSLIIEIQEIFHEKPEA